MKTSQMYGLALVVALSVNACNDRSGTEQLGPRVTEDPSSS